LNDKIVDCGSDDGKGKAEISLWMEKVSFWLFFFSAQIPMGFLR
jgi:hypothetical protein